MAEIIDENIDYDVRVFAEMLTELPAWTPIAAWFEESDPQEDRWWCSQREHLIFYFMERLFPFPGYYEKEGRKPRGVNLSAKKAYEKDLKCPEAIVWLAESLQVLPADELKSLCGEALKIKRQYLKRNYFIKKNFPWEKIVEKAKYRPELKGREKQQKDLEKRSESLEDSTLLQVDVVYKQEAIECKAL